MDPRIQSLIASDALYKCYIRRDMAKVSIRLASGEEYNASGRTLDVALDRVLSKLEAKTVNVKLERRRKERKRERILDGLEDYDTSGCEATEEESC